MAQRFVVAGTGAAHTAGHDDDARVGASVVGCSDRCARVRPGANGVATDPAVGDAYVLWRTTGAPPSIVVWVAYAEIELTAELVRELLREQQPDLADRPLALGARGWDNQLWRLGDDLAVRLPWQTETADALLLKEHTWLPVLAPLLPLPVPIPQGLGQRSERYPHPWIVTTWVPGTPADRAPATYGGPAADTLAAFLTALHQPAPAGAPEGRGRGGPLTQVAESVAWQLEAMTDLCTAVEGIELGLIPDPDAVRAIWDDAVTAPGWAGPPLWVHGDLHPANVLTADGDLCGVVDFGDLCAGDPALDLAACWILLPDDESIERFQRTYRLASDDATWRRARGWAVWRALGSLLIAAADHPGGKPSWGPPALASLQRLTASGA
jgi:aminoglycoside phosphotransferase (APT) family kinase protein